MGRGEYSACVEKVRMCTVYNSHLVFIFHESMLYKWLPNSIEGTAWHRFYFLQMLGVARVQVVYDIIDGVGILLVIRGRAPRNNRVVIFFSLCKVGSNIGKHRRWTRWTRNSEYVHAALRKVRPQVLTVAIMTVVEEEHSVRDVPSEKQGFVRGNGGRYSAELGVFNQDRQEEERPIAVWCRPRQGGAMNACAQGG